MGVGGGEWGWVYCLIMPIPENASDIPWKYIELLFSNTLCQSLNAVLPAPQFHKPGYVKLYIF